MIERIEPITANLRFETFRGLLDGQRVFIKTAVDPALGTAIQHEAAGLEAMRQLDPQETHYAVPEVLRVTDNTIVTSWIEGDAMTASLTARAASHMTTMLDLFVYLDRCSEEKRGSTRFNRPGQSNNIDKQMGRLKKLGYEAHIDSELVEKTATYARKVMGKIATKFTHGDLQPGNIILSSQGKLWLVDCESCDVLWPRHYNLVNLTFNIGASPEHPLNPYLLSGFERYFERLSIRPEHITDQINFSAAMRILQRLVEELGGNTEPGKDRLPDHLREYLTRCMHLISAGKLFLGVLGSALETKSERITD